MSIKNVVLLGADGKLGPAVLLALVAANFNVTVLKRASSKSKSSYPASVKEIKVADDFPAIELSEALKGQDAVVVTIPGSKTELQMRLAAAAVNAGVKHFIPADFGSCDSTSPRAQELVPLYIEKNLFRQYLAKLAEKNPQFSWTSLVCGHFFDWEPKFLHIDIANKRVGFLDDGEQYWSTSTLEQIAKATAKVLEQASHENIKNKMLYMQSFCITQQQLWKALEKATGSAWEVEKFDSDEFTKQQKAIMDRGTSDMFTKEEKDEVERLSHEATEEVVWVLGTLEADWRQKKDLANERLGLEEESLDAVLSKMVAPWTNELRT